jgi:hypothetical protein
MNANGIIAAGASRAQISCCKHIRASEISHSGYLLDATSPNRLWFDKFCKRNWLNLNGLLNQSVEQLAA